MSNSTTLWDTLIHRWGKLGKVSVKFWKNEEKNEKIWGEIGKDSLTIGKSEKSCENSENGWKIEKIDKLEKFGKLLENWEIEKVRKYFWKIWGKKLENFMGSTLEKIKKKGKIFGEN